MNVRDLLMTLLRYSIKDEAFDKNAIKESLSQEKLATLFSVAKKHDVAHLIAYALEQNGFSFECEEWRLLLKEKEQAVLRYEMINGDINEISNLFESERIDYMMLKGAVLRSYYPQPWMRTSCDIDILVKEESLDRATNALVEKLSYKTDYEKHYHDVSLFSPFGMHLELHHNINETIEEYDKILTRVWQFSYKAEKNCYKHFQSNEFLVFHLMAHMAYHFVSGGCGIRSVMDMWVIKNSLELDENALTTLLHQSKLLKFYNRIMELADYWFEGNKQPIELVQEMEKYILLGGAYGTKAQSAVSKQAKSGGKFKYIWSRIFMPYKNLAVLYPIIKKHKILTPFCQIARWFSAIFKRKKVLKEIKIVSAVNKEQLKGLESLLDNLGL